MRKGQDFILYVGGEPLAAIQSNDYSKDRDTIEVCSPESGPEQDFIPGTSSWEMSASGLCQSMEDFNRLEDIMDNGTKVQVQMFDREENQFVRDGKALITSLKLTAKHGKLVSFSIDLQGCGKITKLSDVTEYPYYLYGKLFLLASADEDGNLTDENFAVSDDGEFYYKTEEE